MKATAHITRNTITLLILLLIQISMIKSHWCTLTDTCTYGGLTVNCNNLQLTTIPNDLPPCTACLFLNNNNIARVRMEFKNLSQLLFVDISNNSLQEIAKDSFKTNYELLGLRLNNNKLKYNNHSIPPGTFDSLFKLELLEIQNNLGTDMHTYRDDLFENLQNLKTLNIDGLSGGKPFGQGFARLYNLQSLSIFGAFDYIANDTFRKCGNLSVEELYIRSQRLYDVEPLAFSHFHKLKILNLNDNQNLGFGNMSKGWYGLKQTSIEELHLQSSVPVEKEVITLEKEFYNYLNETRVKKLYLDRNSIVVIMASMFSMNLPHLEVLSLDYNRLQLISSFLYDINQLKNLTYISVSYQMRRFPQPSHLNNPLSSLPQHYGNHTWLVRVPNKLQTIILRESLNYDIRALPKTILIGPTNISLLDYSSNGLHELTGPIYYRPTEHEKQHFVTILASHNDAYYVSPTVLSRKNVPNIRIISADVSYNRLGPQFEEDEEGLIFSEHLDLKSLNLSNNLIKYLPRNVFINLTSLEILNISGNSLRSINFTFSQMKNLKEFDISNNLIAFLDNSVTNDLDKLVDGSNRNLTLHLAGNPLLCSCISLEFLDWLYNTEKIIIPEQGNLVCFLDGRVETLGNVHKLYFLQLKKQCSSKVVMLASSILAGCAFVAIGISVCIYRHRWDIKFVFLQLTNRRKKYQNLAEDDACTYDAFVAYHVNDVPWVKNVLLPNLEGKSSKLTQHSQSGMNFKLCIHHRDFLPGTIIEENIIEKIDQSSKVLLILSNSFVTSSWCEFELQMARMRCFDKGRDIIVVILLEPVSAAAMSPTLRTLIKRVTYIEWPTNHQEEPQFWQRLREAMKAPQVAPLICECGRYIPQVSKLQKE